MNSSIKTLFIDWNFTLSNSKFWEQVSNENHKHHQYYKKIIRWLFLENTSLVNEWMHGKVNYLDVCKIISDGVNLDQKIITNELIVSCKNMELVDNKIIPLVQKIRELGIKVVIASDNMDTFRKFTIPSLKLDKYFDDFLLSNELGLLKGDNSLDSIPFYENYLKKNNCSFSECVLLDDSIDDTKMFQKVGLKAVKIGRRSELVEILEDYAKEG